MAGYFQPYMDKENASQVNILAPTGGGQVQRGIVGKTFQSSSTEEFILKPKRKALGDLNSQMGMNPLLKALGNKLGGGMCKPVMTGRTPGELALAAPVSKPAPTKQLHDMKDKGPEVKSTVHVTTSSPTEWPDREYMDAVDSEEEDDFEDIWPAAEQPATYLRELVDWRPTCLFPLGPTPESDEEEDAELPPSQYSDSEEEAPYHIRDMTLEEADISDLWEDGTGISSKLLTVLPPLEDLGLGAADLFGKLEKHQ